MVLARFLPRDEQFFTHFADAAKNAVEIAELLAEIVNSGADDDRAQCAGWPISKRRAMM